MGAPKNKSHMLSILLLNGHFLPIQLPQPKWVMTSSLYFHQTNLFDLSFCHQNFLQKMKLSGPVKKKVVFLLGANHQMPLTLLGSPKAFSQPFSSLSFSQNPLYLQTFHPFHAPFVFVASLLFQRFLVH